MRIGIDARFVGPEGTGLGKYTEKLIENLIKLDHKNQYILFLRHDNWDYLNLEGVKNFKKVLANVPWYSLKEQLKMPKIYKRENLDVLHVPHFNVPIFYRGKFVVTIHDLIHHHFQETSATTRNPVIFKIKRFGYRTIIKNAILRSAKLVTPSNFVKDEIVKTFGVSPSKIVVTYEAAEEEYFGQLSNVKSQLLLRKYGIKKPFIIYVGNAYPHKNLDRLLEAFKILVHSPKKSVNREPSTISLIIVSARDVFTQRLQSAIDKLEINNRVTVTGYIPSAELAQIFNAANAYVFPSLSEGFGIPGLNAMATGLPVISSNIPVLKEVYGAAASYFDPNNPSDISKKIEKVLTNEKLRSILIKKGRDQAQKYSWQKMAQETLKVYNHSA